MSTCRMQIGVIDLYLAATMPQSQDLLARLSTRGVDPAVAAATAERANRTVFAAPLHVRPANLIELFGAPSRDDPLAITYDLSLWPEHRYSWHIDDGGFASHGGFVLRQASELPGWLSKELPVASTIFRPWYHTMVEVERAFGKPDVESSWFPQQGWYYGPLPDGRYLAFHFDLGLLRELAAEDAPGEARARSHE